MSSFANIANFNLSEFSLAAVKNAANEIRAQVYPKNETERKVYEALSSKNWGASSSLMAEIAQETYQRDKYSFIMGIVWENLNTEGRGWKQIFKTLTLIDFLIKQGSERVVEDSRDHLHLIRPLKDYNYYEEGNDKGTGVREKAAMIIELLSDNSLIREEREKSQKLREKLGGVGSDGRRTHMANAGSGYGGGGYGGGGYGGGGNNSYSDRGGGRGNNGFGNSGGFGNDSYSGGGSYSDGGIDSDSYNRRNGAVGGGAYDSRTPNKYSDDAPSTDSFEVRNSYSTRTNDGDDGKTKSGGKLKVSIKPNNAPPPVPVAAPAPEVNFLDLDDNFGSAPAVPAQAPVNDLDFDAFGSAPAVPAQAPAHNVPFDPFGSQSAPAVPSQAPAHNVPFDPFGSQPAPAVPGNPVDMFGNNNGGNAMAHNNMGYNQNGNMGGHNAMAHNNMGYNQNGNMGGHNAMAHNNMGYNQNGNMGGHNAMAHNNMGYNNMGGMNTMAPPIPQNNADDDDFGGFESAAHAPVANKPKVNAFSAMSSLVNLDNMVGNVSNKPASTRTPAPDTSFSGLDGISRGAAPVQGRGMGSAGGNNGMGYNQNGNMGGNNGMGYNQNGNMGGNNGQQPRW